MRKLLSVFLILSFAVCLFGQSADPRPPRTTWKKELDYIKNGTMTFTYKTLTSPTITGPTFSGSITTTGVFDQTITGIAAAGDKAVNSSITVGSSALTGNLISGAFVATNGTAAAANGVIYGIEAKARAATSAGVGNTIGRLDGVYASVDAKAKTATIMRAFEASLDGAAGGSSTEAVAFEAFNNSSATQTASYAFSANGGTASGHKAYTADMRMQNGELFDNATDGQVQVVAGVLKQAYDALAYWTATVADGGAVTFNSTSDGTAGFTFSDLVTFSAGINLGTSQSLVASTGMTIGGGTETVAINSSDWDIDATGAATNMGSFSSNGDATFTGGDFTGANGNAIDVGEAADGTITFSRDDAGTVTLTSADSDADAALTVAAGGSGALTIGDAGSTTAITSSDWAIDATGVMTGIGAFTSDGAMTVTVPNATADTWVRAIYGTATASGAAMSTGYGAAGVRGLVNVTGTSVGQAYFYGTQGKFTPSAAAVLDGGSWYTGLMGQMDLTAASTYTSVGCISALWLDAGASAGANAKAAAPTMIDMQYITNTAVGFLPHSLIKTVAYATNFMSLANGDGTATGWLAAGGTDCTASGATDPSYSIKVDIAGTTGYIRVWATP